MKVHPLQDDSKPHGYIKFKHLGDVCSFQFCVNSLSGDMLSWFDFSPPQKNSVADIKQIIRNIKDQSEEVIESSFKF